MGWWWWRRTMARGAPETGWHEIHPGGTPRKGVLRLAPGEGEILLNDKVRVPEMPVGIVFTARAISTWGWPDATLFTDRAEDVLRLSPVTGKMEGEHDLLLDYERSLEPYQKLEISAVLKDPDSSMLAVAEVDDPKGEHELMVIEVSGSEAVGAGRPHRGEAVDFRAPRKIKKAELWPWFSVRHIADQQGNTLLDGPSLAGQAGYRFRRWSHLRFVGAVDVKSVSLGKPLLLEGVTRMQSSALGQPDILGIQQ